MSKTDDYIHDTQNVPSLLNRQIDRIVNKAKAPGSSDDVRFNISLSKVDNRRLEYLRRRAKMTKQDFITEILLAAMSDIEFKMDLIAGDSEGDLVRTPEYNRIIKSNKPISMLVKEDDD